MLCRSLRTLIAVATLAIGFTAVASAQSAVSRFWSDVSPDAIAPAGGRVIVPDHFRALTLDRDELIALLAHVPLEGSPAAAIRPEFDLPLPDGLFGRFAIVESPIMAPELQTRYPEIRTYAGYGIDDPSATVRFDLTPIGFHALILSGGGAIYIDPFQREDDRHYQSYYRRHFRSDRSLGGCTVVDEDGMAAEIDRLAANGLPRSGTELRTYRIAVAATGEYTAHFGGTVALGLAAVVVSMNRVNGVYERELSIRMVLVANNNLIIYTNASTDPYTNDNGSTMLGQNQTNLDAVIGNANYDIGHVFSTGGGGIAGLGVVCRTGMKARGVTGSPSPHGDAFDIDYVVHEMGHQFGGNHSFNGNGGNCAGGNRVASCAYEPGSGSTIMAYAGICPPQDLQYHSDDYFHWKSILEIITYSTAGSGNGCPVRTATGAIEPTVDAGVGGFAIPISTPFALTGSATTTGTPTFCWEEADLGPAGHPNSPSGDAPIFRSFLPVASPTRTFPKLSNLLNNTQTIGEILPSYARNLSFKLTVRDVQAGGVGVANDMISFTVASAGPFLVTSPNTAVNWPSGSEQTVTWNVAGTGAAPINCALVNIRLSTDGGNTFPTVLAAGTPNDGSESVILPGTPTTLARMKVEAAANIFFDISNVNFTISQPLTGSCCALDGGCTVTLQAACTGSWTAGGACTPNLCPQPGSCCALDGTCTVTLEAACTGTWTTAGVCTPNTCPQPGSCCALDGTCTVTLQANCAPPSTWLDAGPPCTPNPCPPPTGSCCAEDGTCSVTTETSCSGTWAVFGGCEPIPCVNSGVDEGELVTVLGIHATPNPFTGSVALRVAGPKATSARILIFDAAGRLVRTAWNGTLSGHAFTVSWDGRDDSGRKAPAGIYLVRAEGTSGNAVRRLVMMR
jgi:hypothetical protein